MFDKKTVAGYVQTLNDMRKDAGGAIIHAKYEKCEKLDGASFIVFVYEGEFEDYFKEKGN